MKVCQDSLQLQILQTIRTNSLEQHQTQNTTKVFETQQFLEKHTKEKHTHEENPCPVCKETFTDPGCALHRIQYHDYMYLCTPFCTKPASYAAEHSSVSTSGGPLLLTTHKMEGLLDLANKRPLFS